MKLFVDDLTVIDCSLLDAKRGLTGMSWIVDVVLEGALDDQSMVMDFGKVKKDIKAWIDDGPDHRLVVAAHMPNMTLEMTQNVHLRFDEQLELTCPPQGVYVIAGETVNTQTLTKFLQEEMNAWLADRGIKAALTLREEAIEGPHYCYSHGLKKHDGNCQRIAHGHRSKIEIWRGDARDETLMQSWAADWQDIYLGSCEDIAEQTAETIRFAYDAPQGHFSLTLPKAKCCVIDSDSTVECIATFVAETLKAREPAATFTVKAYEGVRKGAIAEA